MHLSSTVLFGLASSAAANYCSRPAPAGDLAGTPFERKMMMTRTSDGNTYRYYHNKPKDPSMPYLLFVHGFPSSFYDWRHQLQSFSDQGYGVIAPDMLGYGGTDKPHQVDAYKMKTMTKEVMDILNCEGVQKVHGVGHDWGSFFLSRLANYYGSRFLTYSFISNGYSPPGTNLTVSGVQAINAQTQSALGYAIFGYWFFFQRQNASMVVDRHAKSATSIFYTGTPDLWKTDLCPVGALEAFITADKKAPPPNYITPAELATHDKIFTSPGRGYDGPLNWYKVALAGSNLPDDAGIPQAAWNITQPTLLITGARDPVAIPALVTPATKQFCSNLTVQSVNTSHWAHIEAPDQVTGYIQTLVKSVK